MKKNEENTAIEEVVSTVVDAMQGKRGSSIQSLELGALPNSVCQYFIICNADSTTQVEAIAQNVEDCLEQNHSIKPWHKGGYENSLWVVLDYLDVVVHVFQTQTRDHYKLEELWADAPSSVFKEQLAD